MAQISQIPNQMPMPGTQAAQQPWYSKLFLGTPARTETFSRYSDPNIQKSLNDQVMQLLQGNGQSPMEQQTMRQFQSDIVPSITEKFLGSGQSRNTGSLPATLGAAGSGLAQDLQSQRMNQLMQFLQASQGENAYFPAEGGLAHQIIPAAAKIGAAYLNPAGEGLDWIKSLFGGQSPQQEAPKQSGFQEQIQPQEMGGNTAQPSSHDTALQKLITSLIEKNTPQAPGFTPASPNESNPNLYRLGGSYVPANQQGNILNLLLQAIAGNKSGGLNLKPNV